MKNWNGMYTKCRMEIKLHDVINENVLHKIKQATLTT